MIHYFDNAATTPVRPEAVQAAVEAMTQGWGNPSSRYALGAQAAEAVKRHRAQVAAGLGCKPEELFFTSCGTEGDNWAIQGAVELGRRTGKHIITTAIEHAAVLEPVKALAAQGYAVMGMSYRLLPQVDLRGQVQDVFASLHWLEEHGAEHGFDLSRILLTGDSAGGHLAGLTACIQKSPALQALYGVRPLKHDFTALAIVHGVCDVYRFAFLRPPFDQAVSREYQKLLFGPRWKLSPLYGHASFEDTAPGLDLPPILVIASEPDAYFRQSQRLMDYLDRSPWEHEVILWKREQGEQLTHVFEVGWWDWPESQETNRRTFSIVRPKSDNFLF